MKCSIFTEFNSHAYSIHNSFRFEEGINWFKRARESNTFFSYFYDEITVWNCLCTFTIFIKFQLSISKAIEKMTTKRAAKSFYFIFFCRKSIICDTFAWAHKSLKSISYIQFSYSGVKPYIRNGTIRIFHYKKWEEKRTTKF